MSGRATGGAPPWAPGLARHIRLIQAGGVAACLPVLVLADFFGSAALVGALVVIALLAVLGTVLAGQPAVRTPLDAPLVLLLALTPLNLLASADRAASLPHAVKTVAAVVVFYAAAGVLTETRWFRATALAIWAMGLALVPLVILGTNWTGALKLSWLPFTISGATPARLAPFWKPADYQGFHVNLVGGALAMVAPVPIAYALFGGSRRRSGRALLRRLAGGGVALLVVGVLVLTQSRGAILAVMVAAGAMLAARDWRWLIAVAVLAVAVAVAIQAGVLSAPVALDLESDAASAAVSAQGRLELYVRAITMMRDFPLTGIGVGLVTPMLEGRYTLFNTGEAGGLEHLHNVLLHTGAEMGIPGLVALTAFLMGLLVLTWRAARVVSAAGAGGRQGWAAPLTLGMLGVVVAIGTHGMVDTVTYSPRVGFVAWGLLGVAAAVGMIEGHPSPPRVRER